MRLTKSQDKKVLKENTRRKEETEARTNLLSASLGRSYTSRLSNLGNISIRSETEFQLWSDWKPFPDNQLCPCDFLITRIEEWEKCSCCSHQPRLTCSLTDVDLPCSWVSCIFLNWSFFVLIAFKYSNGSYLDHFKYDPLAWGPLPHFPLSGGERDKAVMQSLGWHHCFGRGWYFMMENWKWFAIAIFTNREARRAPWRLPLAFTQPLWAEWPHTHTQAK